MNRLLLAASLALGAVGCESDAVDDGDADVMADDGSSDDSGEAGGSQACVGETRDDFAIGVSRSAERVEVTIIDALPSDPIRGDNGWTLRVTEAAAGIGGAALTVQPWMPDHGHGTPVETEITDLGEGDYRLTPLNLFMAGLWEINLDIELADGSIDEVMFTTCVE